MSKKRPQPSEPQVVMRREMEAGVHKLKSGGVLPPPLRVEVGESDIYTAGEVIDSVLGPVTSDSELAAEIIGEGPNLNLSFSQWVIVQGLVEEGIKAGRSGRRAVG